MDQGRPAIRAAGPLRRRRPSERREAGDRGSSERVAAPPPPQVSPLSNNPRGARPRLSDRCCARSSVFSPGARSPTRSTTWRTRRHRLRLRLLEQYRRLRHQPDADPLYDSVDLWPRLLGRPAQHAAGRASLGIVLATILGFVIGIARLSTNWLVARLAARLCRDHPQHAAAAATCCSGTSPCSRRCRGARQHLRFRAACFLNNRGLFLPEPVFARRLRAGR